MVAVDEETNKNNDIGAAQKGFAKGQGGQTSAGRFEELGPIIDFDVFLGFSPSGGVSEHIFSTST
jgi:hypothetical protein